MVRVQSRLPIKTTGYGGVTVARSCWYMPRGKPRGKPAWSFPGMRRDGLRASLALVPTVLRTASRSRERPTAGAALTAIHAAIRCEAMRAGPFPLAAAGGLASGPASQPLCNSRALNSVVAGGSPSDRRIQADIGRSVSVPVRCTSGPSSSARCFDQLPLQGGAPPSRRSLQVHGGGPTTSSAVVCGASGVEGP